MVNERNLLAENKALKNQVSALQHELTQLKKLIFASKTERFIPATASEQLGLDFGLQGPLVTAQQAPAKESITYERKKKRPEKKHPGRLALPENIPCEDIIIEPQEDTSNMVRMGQEVTETIDYQPGVLIKRRYIRPRYARKEEASEQAVAPANIIIAPMPARPIDKGIAEAGLLAYLFVSKYVDHLPFYRLIEMFKRNHDWSIPKSTLNGWFATCCTLLEPLYQALQKLVLQTDYLQVDESPIKVQDIDKKGATHKGYMWVYHNPILRLVLFQYRKGRGKLGPQEMLSSFSGLLQCDGYKVYDSIAKKRSDINLVSCLAHIRRKFFEAKDHHPDLAQYALQLIGQVYDLERNYKEEKLDPEQIQQRRILEAKPLFQKLSLWVKEEQANNLTKGPIGKALFYAKNQLPLLEAYLYDGRIRIDNNLIENAIRPLAIGRKNYLFAGSHQAAQRAAMMYSFFASCKAYDINPFEWLQDILSTIPNHPINRIEELLPPVWKKNKPKN